ncbi:hypothetical protein SEA_YDN12_45 [Streptomyces phage YDN12]|uniref:Uncharacterized protein n=1 Tax=Streptomyces phage YDN12 TaxID=1636183 RepID=A0A0E3M306_9CAUD|nr:hypothetical protein AVT63_gp44 [Streptomyces phage YDN12]AKA61712.1 hypothetical protein SEA_YDN12_45 [Streptomyces phage YDN12]
MARSIGMAEDATVFRAVIRKKYPDQEAFTAYEGPYGSAAAARARVTFWKNYLNQPDAEGNPVNETDGHVETGTVVWSRMDG